MRTCAAKVQLPSECRISHSSQSTYFDAVALRVVCTRVAMTEGCCRGHLIGPNCKGDVKVVLLREVAGSEQAPSGSYAYGNSRSDLPILRWVEHGYLVKAARPWRHLHLHRVGQESGVDSGFTYTVEIP